MAPSINVDFLSKTVETLPFTWSLTKNTELILSPETLLALMMPAPPSLMVTRPALIIPAPPLFIWTLPLRIIPEAPRSTVTVSASIAWQQPCDRLTLWAPIDRTPERSILTVSA